jgi:mRNA interferase RelE/StbE
VSELATTPEPESLGKPLHDELRGVYRIPFGRYRILYSVSRRRDAAIEVVEVYVRVVLVGIRKEGDKRDVYRLAQRLARRGEL